MGTPIGKELGMCLHPCCELPYLTPPNSGSLLGMNSRVPRDVNDENREDFKVATGRGYLYNVPCSAGLHSG